MLRKNFFYGSLLCLLAHAIFYENPTHAISQTIAIQKNIDLFDTKFLAQYDLVKKTLTETLSFKEGWFTTQDGLRINYLFLERSEALYNVICCSGFYPGRKEGLASFYELLPHANLLLFDARGHGQSDGSLWGGLLKGFREYGKNEYKDIIGAIETVHTKNNKPIILYGLCAGAFNASHALVKLEQAKRLDNLNIKGFVFDSGWTSMTSTSLSALQSYANKAIVTTLSKIYGKEHRKSIPSKLPFKTISTPLSINIKIMHSLFLKNILSPIENETNLYGKMNTLPIPIFFIHSYDDQLAPIDDVKKLFDSIKIKTKTSWWIAKPSSHANHYLKHTDEYKKKLTRFIETTLSQKETS